MRRRTGLIAWLVVIVAVVALFLAWQYLDYRAANRILPPGMTMTDLSVEGLTRDEAFNALEVAFASPVAVIYHGERLTLSPDSVEFRFNIGRIRCHTDKSKQCVFARHCFKLYMNSILLFLAQDFLN